MELIGRWILLFSTLILMACQPSESAEGASISEQTDARSLNEGMLYNAEFAAIFGLSSEGASKLEPGLLAVRVYWTEFVNYENAPRLQVQLYLDSDIPIQVNGDEGAFSGHESLVWSGFRYFPHEPPVQSEEQRKKNLRDFYYRIVLRSEEAGTETQIIHRYQRNLAPGVQVVEFGTSYGAPFHVFLDIGEDTPTLERIMGLFNRVTENPDDYASDEFIRFRFPEKLEYLLTKPYRE